MISTAVPPELLEYCDALTAPRKVDLNFSGFVDGLLWQEFDDILKVRTRRFFNTENTVLNIDPALPFMQKYFSTAEIVRLGSFDSSSDYAWLFSIPNLQLKELRTSKISLVPDNVGFPVTESMR